MTITSGATIMLILSLAVIILLMLFPQRCGGWMECHWTEHLAVSLLWVVSIPCLLLLVGTYLYKVGLTLM